MLRPARWIFNEFHISRHRLRELAAAGLIRSEVRLSPDGTNEMIVYDCDDCERFKREEMNDVNAY